VRRDIGGPAVTRYDTPRIEVHEIASAEEGPYGVAITDDGAVWCSLVRGGALIRLAPDGTPSSIALGGDPDLQQPSLLARGGDDTVWVTDTLGGRVLLVGDDGVRMSIDVPTADAQPFGVASQDDGTVWFTELGADTLGRVDILGRLTEFPSGTSGGFVSMIATSGESVWFTANAAGAIGFVRGGDSAVQIFAVPTIDAGPVGITVGDDGAAWFTEILAGQIGRVDRSGAFTEFALPDRDAKPHAIAADPAGGYWFTLWATDQLGHIDPDGAFAFIDLPSGHSEPHGLAVAADGTVWVALESGALVAVHP
jgi:virginiamycin B lyase